MHDKRNVSEDMGIEYLDLTFRLCKRLNISANTFESRSIPMTFGQLLEYVKADCRIISGSEIEREEALWKVITEEVENTTGCSTLQFDRNTLIANVLS